LNGEEEKVKIFDRSVSKDPTILKKKNIMNAHLGN